MSEDPIVVTTRTSWFSRLGAAFGGILTGLGLVLAGIILLAWNEGRSVQSIRTNNEGVRAVASVSATRVDPVHEGRLIHVTAPASATGRLRDADLGLEADGLSLGRKVQYFQWVETSRSEKRVRLGGGEETITTYSYDRQWVDTPQDSSRFQQSDGHQNPVPNLKSTVFAADRATLGAYSADAAVLNQITPEAPLTPTAQDAAMAAAALSRPVRVVENALYVGRDSAAPEPGDMRIHYATAPQNMVLSVIAAQTGGLLKPYSTKAGAPLLMVHTGAVAADQMFAQAKAANQTLSWILRGVGLVVLMVAVGMILGPLGVLADVLPFLGSIVRVGTGLVAGLTGLVLAALTIASAWIVYRPVIAIGLVVVAGAVVAFLIWRARGRGAKA